MKSKTIILFFLMSVCVANYSSFAQQTTIVSDGEPILQNQVCEATNERIMSSRDTLILADSIIVIHTVCAPICSSHVRVYNKEWKEVGTMKAPFKSAFPEAYIEDGKLLWRDNDTLDYAPAY